MFDLRDVALAALLYDPGMLMRRDDGFDRASLEGLDYPPAVREAALDDGSEPRFETTRIVRAADDLASRRQGPADEAPDPEAPLESLLGFVQLEGKQGAGEPRAYRPAQYGRQALDGYFPVAGSAEDPEVYRRLKRRLAAGFGELADPLDPDAVISLLERYGSYVRSATASASDISLFDHARVTAAIAVCMAGHLNDAGGEATSEELRRPDARRYLFVRADISGVQDFLYTITSKGALRMLRARSVFLELLAEHATAEVLRRAGVWRANVIYVGGGGFQILLPNTPTSEEAVRKTREEVNAALAEMFGYSLYLTLAAVPCPASGIAEDLADTVGESQRQLSDAKARKFGENLDDLFGEPRKPFPKECQVCGRDNVQSAVYNPKNYLSWEEHPQEDEEPLRLCPTCHMLARAALDLPRSRYLRDGTTGGKGFFRIGQTFYGLSDRREGARYALDGPGDPACLCGAAPLPVARYAAARQDGETLEFEELAERAAGVSRLAVLRMDVDNLGNVFGRGLPERIRTFDRYATLSRSFTTFFKLVVPKLCAGGYRDELRLFSDGGKRAATVVYSGGDDLFIVGAWSEVLELAVDIRRAFREFVCQNPSLTLSAGITLHNPGEPLYLMAEQAGEAEKTAKANKEDKGDKNARAKDSVVLFHRGDDPRRVGDGRGENQKETDEEKRRRPKPPIPEALFWDEVEDGVVSLLKRLKSFPRRPDGSLSFPRGFTRLLIGVTEVYERDGHLSLPRLAYALARMEEGSGLREDERWQELKRELMRIEVIKRQLRPAAYWLDLAERMKEQKEETDGAE